METKIEKTVLTEERPVSSDFIETYEIRESLGYDALAIHRGEALSVNISKGGMLLLMDQNPRVQRVLELQVPASTRGKTARLVEVCWTRQISLEVLPMAVNELCAEVSAALRSKSTSNTSWRKPAAPLVQPSSHGFSVPDRPRSTAAPTAPSIVSRHRGRLDGQRRFLFVPL